MSEITSQELPRAFKGIWIPREIWLHPELDCFEKVLWAEIDSLDDPEKGCTASNPYLCKLLNIKERTLQLSLSKLKRLGFIRYESFDGRKRVMRSSLKTTYEKFDTSALKNFTPLPCKILHPERIEEKKEKNPPLPPPKKKAKEGEPPTKEEEEEIEKRFKERPKGSPKIKSKALWKASVLQSMREEGKDTDQLKIIEQRHRKEALERDMQTIDGLNICACREWVEMTNGSYCVQVRYDIPEAEWRKLVRW